jgi:quercetin dioxygenase-like cupin family protein
MTNRPITTLNPTEGHTYAALGNLTCKIPSALTAGACCVLELRLEPGQGAGLHVHQNEDEVILVQTGTCTFGNQEQNWPVEAGGWAVLPKQTPHFFRNTGAGPCTLLITALPGGLDQYFTELNTAIEQKDNQAVATVNEKFGVTFFSS